MRDRKTEKLTERWKDGETKKMKERKKQKDT